MAAAAGQDGGEDWAGEGEEGEEGEGEGGKDEEPPYPEPPLRAIYLPDLFAAAGDLELAHMLDQGVWMEGGGRGLLGGPLEGPT